MAIELLQTIPLFSGLDAEALGEVEQLAKKQSFPKNTTIISQGDDSDSMYVIAHGRCRVIMSDDEGKEVVLDTIGDGDYFGDMALLDKPPRVASVVTVEASEVLVITQPDFSALMEARPKIMRNMLATLIQRQRGMVESVSNLALLDVYGRVARLLLSNAEETSEGEHQTERLTHQEIASMVGSSREMVSRILKDLRLGGYIDVRDKHIVLLRQKLPKRW